MLGALPAVAATVDGFYTVVDDVGWETDDALTALDTIPRPLHGGGVFHPGEVAEGWLAEEVLDVARVLKTRSVNDEHR